MNISTHALTWSATCTNKRRSGLSAFQLTRSRGARPVGARRSPAWCAFQLTRSRGARLEDGIAKKLGVNISTHALTWSATMPSPMFVRRSLFQLTRSRGARLKLLELDQDELRISTHALTWSATCGRKAVFAAAVCISTHALTWSATSRPRRAAQTRSFQLTRSRGARQCEMRSTPLTKRFQLTRSRGARRMSWSGSPTQQLFQLTRSRGARLFLS